MLGIEQTDIVLLSLPSDYSVEPRHDKICIRFFRSCPTQTVLYGHRRWLEACNFEFRKKRYSNSTTCIDVANTKVLISCAVTAQLICAFVFTYVKTGFLMTQLLNVHTMKQIVLALAAFQTTIHKIACYSSIIHS